jgi:hypothetical protein
VTPEEERQVAVDLFNRAWKLMELPQRTPEQDDELVDTAHASAYHWLRARLAAVPTWSQWQLSRVYVVLGRPEPALHHARRCLAWCESNPAALEDWDLAYAHEALARAHTLAGDSGEAQRHAGRARDLAAGVAGEQDREHLEEDLATL